MNPKLIELFAEEAFDCSCEACKEDALYGLTYSIELVRNDTLPDDDSPLRHPATYSRARLNTAIEQLVSAAIGFGLSGTAEEERVEEARESLSEMIANMFGEPQDD